jgi:LmbE family N-acetylglucosaminyl deacetylase
MPDSPPTTDGLFGRARICVVEPHSDDAFLSLGWSIRTWVQQGRQVEVVTVFSADESRALESASWARSIGAGWSGLGYEGYVGEWQPDFAVAALARPLLPATMMEPDTCRIWPLGLENPEHLAVAAMAAETDFRYVDTPYQLHPYQQHEVRQALTGRTIAWWQRTPRQKWKARTFFQSQALLFEEFPPSKLQGLPEIVVR